MVANNTAQNKKESEVKKIHSYSDFNILESGDKIKKMILFLHGAGSDYKMWDNHIKVLESEFYCIAPDLPGHGGSNHLSWSSIEQVGEELVCLIKNKTREKIILVGFSLGGSLSLYLLENYPDLIEKAFIDGAGASTERGIAFALHMASPFLKSNFILKAMAESMGMEKNERDSFIRSIKMTDRKSFKMSMRQACLLNVQNNEFAKTIPILYSSGEKESKKQHMSHIELARLNDKSICVQYPDKGHAWMISDMETHINLISNWINNKGELPGKLKIIN